MIKTCQQQAYQTSWLCKKILSFDQSFTYKMEKFGVWFVFFIQKKTNQQ